MKLLKLVISVIIVLFSLLFGMSASTTHAQSPSTLDCSGGFSSLFPTNPLVSDSITYKEAVLTSPRNIVAHIVKVNLDDNNIDIATTPRMWLGSDTTTFLTRIGGMVAINGSGFYTIGDPLGFNASAGDIYSGSQGDLVFSADATNNAAIAYAVSNPVWDVLSGVNHLVRGGQIRDQLISCPANSCTVAGCDPSYCTVRARTAIGMTSYNTLIIMVTEENSSTLLDMAQMMVRCGAQNALNLDGGGSSTLAADSDNSARPGQTIINNLAGSQRTVSNHLAICAGQCATPPTIVNNVDLPEGLAKPRYSIAQPYPFPCDAVAPDDSSYGDGEFHSLRPYQASPCNPNKEDLALFCGNDLFVGNNVTIVKDITSSSELYSSGGTVIYPNLPISTVSNTCNICSSTVPNLCIPNPTLPCIPGGCTPGSDPVNCGRCAENGNTETCSFSVSGSQTVAVNLSGAEYPIMGYTEPSRGNTTGPRVINSENTTSETMSDATKMNEYVSWYLNGVINRAEYPNLNPKYECVGESTKRVGTCMQTRVNQTNGLNQCLGTWGIPFIDPFVQGSLMPDGQSGCIGPEISCCVSWVIPSYTEDLPGNTNVINYSGPINKLLPFSIQNIERNEEVDAGTRSNQNGAGIRHDQIIGCDYEIELGIPLFNMPTLTIGGIPSKCYGSTFLGVPIDWLKDENRLSDFENHTPPIEEDYLGQDFSEFFVDYRRWKGDACFALTMLLPIIGEHTFYLCFDNPLSPNLYSNLFAHIPYSSTEDRLGDVRIKSGGVSPYQYSPAIRIISSIVTPIKNATLYVPHMEESDELADILQNTYVYKDADKLDMSESGFIPDSPYCEFREMRTNPGDDLFAGELEARIDYTAEITCTFLNWGGGVEGADVGNLCENLISGACVPAGTRCDTDKYFGQFDCGGGEMCCTGTTTPDNSTSCVFQTSGSIIFGDCVPDNYLGISCTAGFTSCSPGFKCVLDETQCSPPLSAPNTLQSCTNPVLANLKLEDRTPLANDVWARLVAGSTGIFRKMFPRIGGADTNFDGIIDMPASTTVSYQNTSPNGGVLYVGNPTSQRSGAGAQLYFPHLGGIKEYFLNGIQTLLRPKGMGQQPVFCEGEDCEIGTGDFPGVDPGVLTTDTCSLSCENDALGMVTPLPANLYNNFVNVASAWFGSACTRAPSQSQYNTVISRATSHGMNPVFALAIWLHESGASNYQCMCQVFGRSNPTSTYCTRAQDFGVNRPEYETILSYSNGTVNVVTDRFGTQLDRFLALPTWYQTLCSSGDFACEWERFGALYHYGQCFASDSANSYVNGIREIYGWLAPGVAFPCYPISI